MKQICYSIVFTFISFFFYQNGQAQSTFVPAKLVKAPGDTVNGFLHFYDWSISPKEIEFKMSLNTPVQTYPASEVESFFIPAKNEWYSAHFIQISFYLDGIGENSNKVARTISGAFFLNEVVKGNRVSLYLLLDQDQNPRYFLRKGSEFTELIRYKYSTFRNGKWYTASVNQYINQLQLLLNDCSTLHISPGLSYTKTALLQVLTSYYTCQGETIQHVQAVDQQPGYNPILIPGFLKVFGFQNYIPSIGVGIKVALPKKFYNRYGILQLDQYRHNFTEAGRKYTGNTYLVTVLGGTYFGKSKIQPFIHGGVQYPSVMWFTAGAGLSYAKKLNLEMRSPSLSGLMMTLHYTFGKIKK
ncbi:hypothetical protein AHMF7605_24815 [Adhaeribacter arboris]|uniref:Uncharacterized protein n=1 Tax=Adhaeribacter arboris TaxID=2072846 RepID=A0A2T2YLU7_9BACT|nr:hypothetical protein [Adhaeribacter arboris]PSR56486.1 hypothetical protein AHMF7605_24815 [Adhaeribacter arboris]